MRYHVACLQIILGLVSTSKGSVRNYCRWTQLSKSYLVVQIRYGTNINADMVVAARSWKLCPDLWSWPSLLTMTAEVAQPLCSTTKTTAPYLCQQHRSRARKFILAITLSYQHMVVTSTGNGPCRRLACQHVGICFGRHNRIERNVKIFRLRARLNKISIITNRCSGWSYTNIVNMNHRKSLTSPCLATRISSGALYLDL